MHRDSLVDIRKKITYADIDIDFETDGEDRIIVRNGDAGYVIVEEVARGAGSIIYLGYYSESENMSPLKVYIKEFYPAIMPACISPVRVDDEGRVICTRGLVKNLDVDNKLCERWNLYRKRFQTGHLHYQQVQNRINSGSMQTDLFECYDTLYTVISMDYAMTLANYLNKRQERKELLSQEECLIVLKGIVKEAFAIHDCLSEDNDILVHLDLSLKNIMVESSYFERKFNELPKINEEVNVSIIDYDSSIRLSELDRLSDYEGFIKNTISYGKENAAPELRYLVDGNGYETAKQDIGIHTDIFSLGRIMKKIIDVYMDKTSVNVLAQDILNVLVKEMVEYLPFKRKRLNETTIVRQLEKALAYVKDNVIIDFALLHHSCLQNNKNLLEQFGVNDYTEFLVPDISYGANRYHDLQQILSTTTENRYWITGQGGAGKSVMIMKYVEEKSQKEDQQCLIYIALNSMNWLSGEEINNCPRYLIYHFIKNAYLTVKKVREKKEYQDAFDILFAGSANENITLIFDGYNEVYENRQRRLISAIYDLEKNTNECVKFVISSRGVAEEIDWTRWEKLHIMPIANENLYGYFNKKIDVAELVKKYGDWIATPLMAKIYRDIYKLEENYITNWKESIREFSESKWYFEEISDEPKTKTELIELWWLLQYYRHVQNGGIYDRRKMELYHFMIYHMFPAICYYAYRGQWYVSANKKQMMGYIQKAYAYYHASWGDIDERYETLKIRDILLFNNCGEENWGDFEKGLLGYDENKTYCEVYFENIIENFFEQKLSVLVHNNRNWQILHQDLGEVLVAIHLKNTLELEVKKAPEVWGDDNIWSNDLEKSVGELLARGKETCIAQEIIDLFAGRDANDIRCFLGKLFDIEQVMFGGIYGKKFIDIDMSELEFGRYRFSKVGQMMEISNFEKCNIERVCVEASDTFFKTFCNKYVSPNTERNWLVGTEWELFCGDDSGRLYKLFDKEWLFINTPFGECCLYSYGIFWSNSLLGRIYNDKMIFVKGVVESEFVEDECLKGIPSNFFSKGKEMLWVNSGKARKYQMSYEYKTIVSNVSYAYGILEKEWSDVDDSLYDVNKITIVDNIVHEEKVCSVKTFLGSPIIVKDNLYYIGYGRIYKRNLLTDQLYSIYNDKIMRFIVSTGKYIIVCDFQSVMIYNEELILQCVLEKSVQSVYSINEKCIYLKEAELKGCFYNIERDYLKEMGQYHNHNSWKNENYTISFEENNKIFDNWNGEVLCQSVEGGEIYFIERKENVSVFAEGKYKSTYIYFFSENAKIIKKVKKHVERRLVDWRIDIEEGILYILYIDDLLGKIEIEEYSLLNAQKVSNYSWYKMDCRKGGFGKDTNDIYLSDEQGYLHKLRLGDNKQLNHIFSIQLVGDKDLSFFEDTIIIDRFKMNFREAGVVLAEIQQGTDTRVLLNTGIGCYYVECNQQKVRKILEVENVQYACQQEDVVLIFDKMSNLYVIDMNTGMVSSNKKLPHVDEKDFCFMDNNLYILCKIVPSSSYLVHYKLESGKELVEVSFETIARNNGVISGLDGAKLFINYDGYYEVYDIETQESIFESSLTSRLRNCRFINCLGLSEEDKEYIQKSGGIVE